MTRDLANVLGIYAGSDGEATRALYAELMALGPVGEIAVNLFRACKSSARAKVYRGRGYRGAAYDRKGWSLDNLSRLLAAHGQTAGVAAWGWKQDPAQAFHSWVLYVDLPTGQVSFHSAGRGEGPDYAGEWDGERNASAGRICRFVVRALACKNAQPIVRADGGCLACDADAGEACR